MSWFAAKTKQKGEFKALDFFNSMGINCYVPSYVSKRVWSDRIKKITVPAINGYIFFELNKIDYNLINLNFCEVFLMAKSCYYLILKFYFCLNEFTNHWIRR